MMRLQLDEHLLTVQSAVAWDTHTESHRIVGVGRDLCGSPSPTPPPKQGHLQQAAQDLVQAGLEYLQRRRLHNLPGQPVPVLRHPQREEVLPHVQTAVLLVPACCRHREEMTRKPRWLVASLVPPPLLSPVHQAEELEQQRWAAAIGCRWCHLAYSPGAPPLPYAISLQQHGKYFIPYSKGCLIFYYFKAAHECFTEMISSGGGWNGKVQGKFPAQQFWGWYSSHPVPVVAVNLVC